MGEAGGERDLHRLGAVDLRVRENRFEGRIGDDQFAAPARSILSIGVGPVNVSAQTFRISPEPSPSRI